MIPLFIEVTQFVPEEIQNGTETNWQIDFTKTQPILIPLSWIGPISPAKATRGGKLFIFSQVTVTGGQTIFLKDSFEEVSKKIKKCLPPHVQREPWEEDND